MRIVRHPNIVELKAFYYSNGDRVSAPGRDSWHGEIAYMGIERGSIPQPRTRICARNRVPGVSVFQ